MALSLTHLGGFGQPEATGIFKFEVITAGADTFQLPIYSGGIYNFLVDWGDGNKDHITAFDDTEANHSYGSASTFNVEITGILNGWRFNDSGDKTLIGTISEWGPFRPGNLNGWFYGCTNLDVTATDAPNLEGVTTMKSAFRATGIGSTGGWSSWDVSSIESLQATFRDSSSFNQDISNWDTSSVTSFAATFFACTSFSIDIDSWDVSAGTSMNNMFQGSSYNIDIGSWILSAVTTMNSMFQDNTSFNQDIGSWNTGAVLTMTNTFTGATAFNQDLSSWDIADVTDLSLFLSGTAFSTTNYDLLLVAWEGQSVQNNVTAHFGSANYNTGAPATARADLVADHTWSITDGGAA